MYLWLVLSTFLAILAGYSLPVRSDLSEKKDIPVATAYVYRLIVNHRTAMDYVKSKKWPYYCGGAEVSDGVVLEECDDVDRIGYEAGLVTSEMVEDFKPDDFIFDEEHYISRVFCYNADGSEAEDCLYQEGNEKKRYLITYGDLHEKWLSSSDWNTSGTDRREVAPRDDILRGLGENFASDTMAGYVREDSEGAYIINGWGTNVFTFLPDMWEEIFNSGMCNKDFNGSCMIYVNAL